MQISIKRIKIAKLFEVDRWYMAEIFDFEELSDSRQENNKRRSKKRKKFFAFLFVLVICGTIFLVCGMYANKRVLNFDIKTFTQSVINNITKTNTNNSSQRFVPDEVSSFYEYNDYIVQCKSNEVIYYDIYFKKIWNKNVTLREPVARVNGDYLAIGDIHGKEIFLLQGTNIKCQIDVGKEIINFDIARNGYISVITDTKQGKSEVTVFTEKGEKVYSHVFNDNFVISAKYNSNNKQLYVNKLDTSGSEVGTVFEAYNFTDEKPIFSLSKSGHVYPFWGILNDDSIYGYSEQSFVSFDKNGKEKWNNEFVNGVYGCAVVSDRYPVIADADVSTVDNKMKVMVKILNDSGKQKNKYEYGGNIKNICSVDGLICLNTGYEVLFLSSSGELKGKATSDTEILDVLCVKNNTVVFKIKNGIMISEI